MQKVQMTVHGREALVDADMVKLMTKKAELVKAAMNLQHVMDSVPTIAQPILQKQLNDIAGKIIRLNRRIRQNVQFI